MRVFALTLLVAGCGGGGSDTAGTDAGDTDTDGGTSGDPCGSIPSFDLDGMSCAQLASAYEDTIDAADGCAVAADCRAFNPGCATWDEVGCWYAANDCAADALDEFASHPDCAAPSGGGCNCGGAPELDCVSGKCQLVYASY